MDGPQLRPGINKEEAMKWRSEHGYSFTDLVNWFYQTQYVSPYSNIYAPDQPFGHLSDEIYTDASTWQGKNYGKIHRFENDQLIYDEEGHKEALKLRRENNPNYMWVPTNYGQAYEMAEDMSMSNFWWNGSPYQSIDRETYHTYVPTEKLEKDIRLIDKVIQNIANNPGKQDGNWVWDMQTKSYIPFTQWEEGFTTQFSNKGKNPGEIGNDFVRLMWKANKWKDKGELEKYLNSIIEDGSLEKRFTDNFSKENDGESIWDPLLEMWEGNDEYGSNGMRIMTWYNDGYTDNSIKKDYIPDQDNYGLLVHKSTDRGKEIIKQKELDNQTNLSLQPKEKTNLDYIIENNVNQFSYMDNHQNLNPSYLYNQPDITDISKTHWWDNRAGQWVPNGETRLYENPDKRSMEEIEFAQNMANMASYANPFNIGKPNLYQDRATWQKMANTPNTTGGDIAKAAFVDPLTGVAEGTLYYFAGAGALRLLNNPILKSAPWLNKIMSSTNMSQRLNPVRGWDLVNAGYAAGGIYNYGPSMVENYSKGKYLDGTSDLGNIALNSMFATGSFQRLNRSLFPKFQTLYKGQSTKSLFPQFNIMPSTSSQLSKTFNLSKPGSLSNMQQTQFLKDYNQFYGPAYSNLPRFSIINPFRKNKIPTQKSVKKALDFLNQGAVVVP